MPTKTVGRFSYDPETQTLSGPSAYMADQGDAKLNRILAGQDTVFNMTARRSPDTITAILVALQTDFAGWAGAEQLARAFRRSA